MTTPHPQAEILRAIADGKTVQMRSIKEYDDNEWWEPSDILQNINDGRHEFRIKPETININGFEVPCPLRTAPPIATEYWCTSAEYPECPTRHIWINDGYDLDMLRLGIVHLTEEAAIAHAKALLSFTGVKGG